MPRLIQSVPKYRKHRASGQALCTIAGRDYYLGPHGTKASKLGYDRLIAEWLVSGRSAAFGVAEEDLTIVELVADYLRYAKEYYGPGPRGEYANMKRAAAELQQLYGRTSAAEFGPQQLKAIRQRLIEGGGSRTYINACVQRVVRIFRWGAGEGKLPAAVPQALAMVPGLRRGRSEARETSGVSPVDAATVAATLPHLSRVVRAMVEFQRLTGCRPGEVCSLRAGDVDRSSEVWEAQLSEHKTAHRGHTRVIYIGPEAQVVLAPFLLRAPEEFCFSPSEAVKELRARREADRRTPPSCGNRRGTNQKQAPSRSPGERYTTTSYARAIRRACEQAGIERWTANQLRHLVATEVRREFDLESAQVVLGHAQANVTQVYAQRDRGRALEVAKRIG